VTEPNCRTVCSSKARVALDDGAGLVAVQARHQDVAKNQVRLVIVDLGQSIKAIFGQQDLVATLLEKNFRAAADGVAVINDQHLEGLNPRAPCRAHLTPLP